MINNGQNYGSFVPTTNVWDPQQLFQVEITSPEFKEILVRLYQNINLIAIALNSKDSGIYVQDEFVNGQLFFEDPSLTGASSTNPSLRNVYRTVVNFGALPNNTIKSVAHNIPITSAYTFTRIYGAASDTVGLTYIPLPYVDDTGSLNIQLDVDNVDVNVTTNSDRTNYTVTYIILEYLKF